MLDAVRKNVGAGREALTPKAAEDLARQGQTRKDQVSKLARDLLAWSRKSSERLRDTIRREVNRQIARSGLATVLGRRIRKIEAARKPAPTSTARTASRRRTTSRKRTTSSKG
jgi:hypothetical protein